MKPTLCTSLLALGAGALQAAGPGGLLSTPSGDAADLGQTVVARLHALTGAELLPQQFALFTASTLTLLAWLLLHLVTAVWRHRYAIPEFELVTASERFASLAALAFLGFAIGLGAHLALANPDPHAQMAPMLPLWLRALSLLGAAATLLLTLLQPWLWKLHHGSIRRRVALLLTALAAWLTSWLLFQAHLLR